MLRIEISIYVNIHRVDNAKKLYHQELLPGKSLNIPQEVMENWCHKLISKFFALVTTFSYLLIGILLTLGGFPWKISFGPGKKSWKRSWNLDIDTPNTGNSMNLWYRNNHLLWVHFIYIHVILMCLNCLSIILFCW